MRPGFLLWLAIGLLLLPMTAGAQRDGAVENAFGMRFVPIPAGNFTMGSPPDEPARDADETPHRVTISEAFYLQTTEVTRAQWRRVVGQRPPGFRDCGPDCPVEGLDAATIDAFVRHLNSLDGQYRYRLPTEAEWEYAARAGRSTAFATGDCLTAEQANVHGGHPYPGCEETPFRGTPLPVASFPANPWGLYDMHGNVWEMCQDWYGSYPKGPVTDAQGPSTGEYRVLRGGSWRFHPAHARSANRFRDRVAIAGFRLVLERRRPVGQSARKASTSAFSRSPK